MYISPSKLSYPVGAEDIFVSRVADFREHLSLTLFEVIVNTIHIVINYYTTQLIHSNPFPDVGELLDYRNIFRFPNL